MPHFFPAWEVLPHESKLPHFDVISERLETLGALLDGSAGDSVAMLRPVVTSVTALLQRTFPAGELRMRTRCLERGQSLNPLDFIEWLEEQGYEPEAKVTSKGELSWRGGIVDLWPLSAPWPIRLEFFGDELESLREFDPGSQISRETVEAVRVPPAGEISLLKAVTRKWESDASAAPAAADPPRALGTLLDYLPPDSLLVLSDPEALLDQALRQGQQITPGDSFHARWEDLLAEAGRRGMTVLALCADDASEGMATAGDTVAVPLDAFRPIGTTLPEAQVAEVQRRSFFHQMHRWIRQGLAVHVFCNNEGEQQRFSELWTEYGLDEASLGSGGGVMGGCEVHTTIFRCRPSV